MRDELARLDVHPLVLNHVDIAETPVGGNRLEPGTDGLQQGGATIGDLLRGREVLGIDSTGDGVGVGEAGVDHLLKSRTRHQVGVATDFLQRRLQHLLEQNGRPVSDGHPGGQTGG